MDLMEISIREVRDSAEDDPTVTVTEEGNYICE
jgi:hypothetical protein